MVRAKSAEREPGAKLFDCPECPPTSPSTFQTPEGLGAHLERHRPVEQPEYSPRGKLRSRPCPRECGRHFPIRDQNRDYIAHIAVCDGSAPIAAVEASEVADQKEANVADLKCEKCPALDFKNPQALGAHRRHEHPGDAKPRRGGKPAKNGSTKPAKKKTKAAGGNGVVSGMIEQLQEKREEILAGIPELASIDKAIAALQEVQGGG